MYIHYDLPHQIIDLFLRLINYLFIIVVAFSIRELLEVEITHKLHQVDLVVYAQGFSGAESSDRYPKTANTYEGGIRFQIENNS